MNSREHDKIVAELLAQHGEVAVSFAPDSTWQADDREWFASHADRGYRLRRTHEDERSPAASPLMLVRRVTNGVRAKQSVYFVGTQTAHLDLLLASDPVADPVLAMLWEAIRTGSRVSIASLVAQAHGLHSMTRQ